MKEAPVIILPEIHITGDMVGPGEIIEVPIITKGFDDICAITLNFQFDNSVLNYVETIPNPEIFNVEAGVPPPILMIQNYQSKMKTLIDGQWHGRLLIQLQVNLIKNFLK